MVLFTNEYETYTKTFWEDNNKLYYTRTYNLLQKCVEMLNKIVEFHNKEKFGFIPEYKFIGFNEIKICNIKFDRNEQYNYLVIYNNKIETPFGVIHITNIGKNNKNIIKIIDILELDITKLEPNMVDTLRNGSFINGYRYILDSSYNYIVPMEIIKKILLKQSINI